MITPVQGGWEAMCNLCPRFVERWNTERAAQAAVVWHVYEAHADYWQSIVGSYEPRDPHPAMIFGAKRL